MISAAPKRQNHRPRQRSQYTIVTIIGWNDPCLYSFCFFINDDGDDDKMATITTMFELFSQNFWQLINETRYFFYLANPYETMFPDMNVPRYVSEVGVFFQ